MLEDLRNAAKGSLLSVVRIIDHAEDLASGGQAKRGLNVMELAASYPRSFSKDEFDILRLARARMQATLGPLPRATITDLERLVNDEDAVSEYRAEAILRLARISAELDGYMAAAVALDSHQTGSAESVCQTPSVVLARISYLLLAGDFALALQDTESLLEGSEVLTSGQLDRGRVQHAWALTQLGRFEDSRKFIVDKAHSQFRYSNALGYIDAWNAVGAENISLREALKSSSFVLDTHPEDSEWSQSFFQGWSAFAENNLNQALEIFTTLPTGPEVDPVLNGTFDELALQGKAHTLLELGDYKAAYSAFRQISSAIPDRPVGVRLEAIVGAQHYGLLAAKLNSVSAVENVSAARRSAQLSFGIASPLLPRLMDIEAELLLANERPAEARALRVIALEIMDKSETYNLEERLSHQLGLYLIEAHENRTQEALIGLRSVIPELEMKLGRHHEKTIIARYSLTSLTDPLDQNGTDHAAFETLCDDLTRTFGTAHLLTLKAQYGLARRMSSKGKISEALDLYTSIEALLPDLPQNLNFKTSVGRRIADSHRSLGQYEKAQDAYLSALSSLKASISPSPHRELEIQLDIHECLLKRGQSRQSMSFFSSTASRLRETSSQSTTEYFRAVLGYASCLELLKNHAGAAHNYGHLVRMLDKGVQSEKPEYCAEIYSAGAWNNELSKNFSVAAALYKKAIAKLREAGIRESDARRVSDLEHRILCCSARLQA